VPDADAVTVVLRVEGVAFESLAQNSTLKNSIEETIAEGVAESASVQTDDVFVVLSAGSILATSTIRAPSNMTSAALLTSLNSQTSSLTTNVATAINSIDGISTVATGPITADVAEAPILARYEDANPDSKKRIVTSSNECYRSSGCLVAAIALALGAYFSMSSW